MLGCGLREGAVSQTISSLSRGRLRECAVESRTYKGRCRLRRRNGQVVKAACGMCESNVDGVQYPGGGCAEEMRSKGCLRACTSVLGLKPLWAWQHMWLVLAGAGDVIVGQQHNIARSPQALTTSIAGVYLSWQSVDATTVLASIEFFLSSPYYCLSLIPFWRNLHLAGRIHNESSNTAPSTKWRALKFWLDAIDSAERGSHAALLQASLQVSTDGLRDGYMGNHELDNSAEEGLQADILPCMANSMLRDI